MTSYTKKELGKMKALALYGEYFQTWAMLENEVLNCIEKALGLNYAQRVATFSHIMWRDRIDILRTLVSLTIFDKARLQEYDKRLVKIAALAGTRNMAAHNLFFESEDGSLTFYQTKAKGKVETPIHKWTRKSVDDLIMRLIKELQFLIRLNSDIKRLKGLSDMTSSLMHSGTNALAGLASGPVQFPPAAHEVEASPEASDETDPPAEQDQ